MLLTPNFHKVPELVLMVGREPGSIVTPLVGDAGTFIGEVVGEPSVSVSVGSEFSFCSRKSLKSTDD